MSKKRIWNSIFIPSTVPTAKNLVDAFDEIHDALVNVCGLVQTNDTGQLPLGSTVAYVGAAGTDQLLGYRVYRFNDTLKDIAPIFIRLEARYRNRGTTASVQFPYYSYTVGTGSNGSGLITGGVTSYAPFDSDNSSLLGTNTTNLYRVTTQSSAACGGEGFSWLSFKNEAFDAKTTAGYPSPAVSGLGTVVLFFGLFRSTDNNGNVTSDGFWIVGNTVNPIIGVASWAVGSRPQATFFGSMGAKTVFDFGTPPMLKDFPTSNGRAVLFKIPTPYSGYAVTPFMGILNATVTTSGDIFEAELVGSTPRTYIFPSPGLAPMNMGLANTSSWSAPFLIWEGDSV